MKICVTGGAGFIGINFLHYMIKKYLDYTFVCLDNLSNPVGTSNLATLSDKTNFNFINADITDSIAVNQIFAKEKFDIVINFAAETKIDNFIENTDIYIKTNLIGTQILLEACRKYGIKHFHQISTVEVYGELPREDGIPMFTETSPIAPANLYAASKAAADVLVIGYSKTYYFPATISRIGNSYGPYQHEEKIISWIIKFVLQSTFKWLPTKDENRHDWIYIKDYCSAIDKIIHSNKKHEIYNISGNNKLSDIKVIKEIFKIFNMPDYSVAYINYGLNKDLQCAIDYSKIRNELGWNLQYTFNEGLKETVNWHIERAEKITIKDLSCDVQQMLNTLVDDEQKDEFYLPISKIKSHSRKRCILEENLYNNPKLDAETLYVSCLLPIDYNKIEAKDIIENKKGKFIDSMSDGDFCIYNIGSEKEFKYILIQNMHIIGYINLSIKNKLLIINNLWNTCNSLNNKHIKDFLKKWFIPKYNLNITNKEVNKLLNNTETNQNNIG